MALRSNKAFSLLETIIAVAIFSSALVFVLRAFTTVLFGARLGQDMTMACMLGQDVLWQIERAVEHAQGQLPPAQGNTPIQGKQFKWNWRLNPADGLGGLCRVDLAVSWPESAGRENGLELSTYLACK